MKPSPPEPPPLPPDAAVLTALRDRWAAAWPGALAVWSRFTRLRPPALCLREEDARREGLTGSFAMIRLTDQAIVVSLPNVFACRVGDFAREILAHEIGHHVLAPATLTDHARVIARMRYALPTVERHAPTVANLYTDLLINDRLQRGAEGLQMAEIYRVLSRRGGHGAGGAVWALYLRIYERLWSLPRASLGGMGEETTDDALEGDALLGARLMRSYARDFLGGAGRFAALLLPYLMADQEKSAAFLGPLLDTRAAGAGGDPSGLSEPDPGERAGAVHPALDPALTDDDNNAEGETDPPPASAATPDEVDAQHPARGQTRQPFEYGEILRAAGLDLPDHEVAVRYYRERARPHLIPFPTRPHPRATDPLPEGLETWAPGDSLDEVDWLGSVLQSPRIVPGLTTVRRVWGEAADPRPSREPLDLDLYVDSSGSMANPQQQLSFPTLAGAILCGSALRAGARVQVTLWSGKHQWTATDGFVRDEPAILRVLTGYLGGGTAFPLHRLRETYAKRGDDARPAHILVISDDGVSTMFDQKDEQGTAGKAVAEAALRKARGGGTLALNLPEAWEQRAAAPAGPSKVAYPSPYKVIQRARDEGGWAIYRITQWDELVRFAREWSRQRYGQREFLRPRMEHG